MEIIVGVSPFAWPRYQVAVVLKLDSTPLKESPLLKRRKLRFREMIFELLNNPSIKPWKFRERKKGYELPLAYLVELGVHRFEGFGSCRVYMGVAPTGTIPATFRIDFLQGNISGSLKAIHTTQGQDT